MNTKLSDGASTIFDLYQKLMDLVLILCPYPAQRFLCDAEVGSNMPQLCTLQQQRIICQQLLVALFGSSKLHAE